jgi:hypothetical protein
MVGALSALPSVGYTTAMAKLLFIPVSVGGGLLAGFVS